MSKKFHNSSKMPRGVKLLPIDQWPDAWKIVNYKEYARFPRIPLYETVTLPPHLSKVLQERKSSRDFLDRPLDLNIIGTILIESVGLKVKTSNELESSIERRFYPSAGARYPIEVYLISTRNTKDLTCGVYHYNVRRNWIEFLFPLKSFNEPKYFFADNWASLPPIIIVLTSVFGRTQIKYGERGYRYSLIEAGHIGENIQLVATELSLKTCPLGGFIDDGLNDILEVDGENEAAIYAIALGY